MKRILVRLRGIKGKILEAIAKDILYSAEHAHSDRMFMYIYGLAIDYHWVCLVIFRYQLK